MLRDRAREKGLTLTGETRAAPNKLLGDPLRMQQALLNYVANAIKCTPSGHVTVRAYALREDAENALWCHFEVIDTGVGVAAEAAPRLFSSFEQADNSTTRQYGGTGLGLAITQKIAELMGGEVGVESMPGLGSLFWFTARLRKGEAIAEDESPWDKTRRLKWLEPADETAHSDEWPASLTSVPVRKDDALGAARST